MIHEGFEFKIKPDLTVKGSRFYCVMQNPFTDEHDTRVLFGGSIGIVERKIIKQFEKFRKEKESVDR
ncbi:MAG TPA: hypothetical protein VFD17_07140 [Clostridia bacterium]|nr:hypothetical protein [Clostridia bacterium]